MGVALLAGGGCAGAPATSEPATAPASATRREGETREEAHYRHGVRCMDELERDACAIEQFEAVLASSNARRAHAGDAMLRLVTLYGRNGQESAIKPLLRGFWERGMDRGSAGLVPYSLRFLDPRVTVVAWVDVVSLVEAKVMGTVPTDSRDRLFTCDEARREQLEAKAEAAKAAKAAQDAKAKADAEAAGTAMRKSEPRRGPPESRGAQLGEPVYDEHLCGLTRALGHTDLRVYRAVLLATNHSEPTISAAVVVRPGVRAELAAAASRGALEPVAASPGEAVARWRLPGASFGDDAVEVANLDGDELVLAPAAAMPAIVAARGNRETELNPELDRMLERVPADVNFFTVMTKMAMRYQFAEFGAMSNLLPTPDGLLVSAVMQDFAGLFVRMPTSDPLKAMVLVAVVRQALASDLGESDPEALELRRNFDVSQSDDGSLLLSAVLERGQVQTILTQDGDE
jgi:hypothetical protein